MNARHDAPSPARGCSTAQDRRTRRLVLAFLALVLAFAFPYFGRFMNANERPRLLQAVALVDAGSFAIDGPATRGIDPGIDVSRAPEKAGGRLYPNKPPGGTIPAVLAYAPLRWTCDLVDCEVGLRGLTWLSRILGAWLPTIVLVGLALRRLPPIYGSTPAIGAVVFVTLGTPLFSYARLLYGHTLSACLLYGGTLLMVDGVTRPDAEGRSKRAGLLRPGLGGAICGCAVAVEYLAVFAGIPLGAWLLLRVRQGTPLVRVSVAIAGAVVPIVLLMAYHAHAFGSPFSTGYHHVVREAFAETHARGLLGLGLPTVDSLHEQLLSPWGGLLWWAPLSVVGVAGLVHGLRRRTLSVAGKIGLAIVTVIIAVNLGLEQTGGWRVGPRYMVLAFPFLFEGVAIVLADLRRHPLGLGAVLGLALSSVLINTLAADFFPHLIPAGNPLNDLLLPLAGRDLQPYHLLGVAGLHRGLWLEWILIALLLALASRDLIAHHPLLTLVSAIITAALVFTTLLQAPAAPDAGHNLEAITKMWEPIPSQQANDRKLQRWP